MNRKFCYFVTKFASIILYHSYYYFLGEECRPFSKRFGISSLNLAHNSEFLKSHFPLVVVAMILKPCFITTYVVPSAIVQSSEHLCHYPTSVNLCVLNIAVRINLLLNFVNWFVRNNYRNSVFPFHLYFLSVGGCHCKEIVCVDTCVLH